MIEIRQVIKFRVHKTEIHHTDLDTTSVSEKRIYDPHPALEYRSFADGKWSEWTAAAVIEQEIK